MNEQKEEKRLEYLERLRPISDKRFQHFASEQQKLQYIEAVKLEQESGAVLF